MIHNKHVQYLQYWSGAVVVKLKVLSVTVDPPADWWKPCTSSAYPH
jgi:hypothetical protein